MIHKFLFTLCNCVLTRDREKRILSQLLKFGRRSFPCTQIAQFLPFHWNAVCRVHTRANKTQRLPQMSDSFSVRLLNIVSSSFPLAWQHMESLKHPMRRRRCELIGSVCAAHCFAIVVSCYLQQLTRNSLKDLREYTKTALELFLYNIRVRFVFTEYFKRLSRRKKRAHLPHHWAYKSYDSKTNNLDFMLFHRSASLLCSRFFFVLLILLFVCRRYCVCLCKCHFPKWWSSFVFLQLSHL